MFDSHFHHRDDLNPFHHNIDTHLSTLHSRDDQHDVDDDDDMALGDEAGAGLLGNMSDDDGNISRSLNVSPTMEDDDDEDTAPELIDHKQFRTPPLTPPNKQTMNKIYHQEEFSSRSNDDLHNQNNRSTITNSQQTSSLTDSHHTLISNSNFSPTIQNWLRDSVQSRSNPSSYHDKPWSRSTRPWSLDKLQREIERFHRLNDTRNTLETSKKMLKNGVLGLLEISLSF